MARPRVADRGDGLQIWRVAVNILNKQSRTVDSGWYSSLEVGRGLTNLPLKTQYLLRITTHSLGTGRITWHNKHRKMRGFGGCGLDSTGSGQGPVAGCCECGDEPSGSCATELVS
jgi:hypothetical protein